LERFWVYSFISGGIIGGLLMLTNVGALSHVFLTFFGFMGLPRFVLKFLAGRRQKKFLEDFPDALEAMVRLLQAGMPVSEAIAMVAREFIGPVGDEMMRIYEDQKVGITMGDAAKRAADRMPLTEMQMFATAIEIQTETGSSLSEVLSNIANVIRSRFKL
jgi:tight adherence protein B